MKYMMFVCVEEDTELTPEESREIGPATEAWVAEMDGRGVRLQGNRLGRSPTRRPCACASGEVVIADGPFAETKEQIGGYDILECADLDEAHRGRLASTRSPASASIEVRPFAE